METSSSFVFRAARIFDGESGHLRTGLELLVADGVIRQISESPITVNQGMEIVDCGGRVLMPGLIDAHVHVYASGLNVTRVARNPAHISCAFRGAFSAFEPGSGLHDSSGCWWRRRGPRNSYQRGIVARDASALLRRPVYFPDRRPRRLPAGRLRPANGVLWVPRGSTYCCGGRR